MEILVVWLAAITLIVVGALEIVEQRSWNRMFGFEFPLTGAGAVVAGAITLGGGLLVARTLILTTPWNGSRGILLEALVPGFLLAGAGFVIGAIVQRLSRRA